jgi:hypothetical protein
VVRFAVAVLLREPERLREFATAAPQADGDEPDGDEPDGEPDGDESDGDEASRAKGLRDLAEALLRCEALRQDLARELPPA